MAVLFRPGVDSIMLGTRCGLEIFGVIPLQALHESRRHLAGQEGIFPPRLLSAPPTRIAKNIHIRRPEGKTLILIGIAVTTQRGMIFRAPFLTNSRCNS